MKVWECRSLQGRYEIEGCKECKGRKVYAESVGVKAWTSGVCREDMGRKGMR